MHFRLKLTINTLRHSKKFSLPRILSLILAVVLTTHASEPRIQPEILTGAYYFDGWTGQTDRWHLPERMTGEFADREPVWGWVTSTPGIMREQIDLAAIHGLDFFAFCWYHPDGKDKCTPLNQALQLYLEAPNHQRLQFCLLVANHAGFNIGPDDWEVCTDQWLALFKNPSYVKVEGAPLIIFHSPYDLNKSMNGPTGVKAAFESLREKVIAAGFSDVAIAGCWTARNVSNQLTLPRHEVESGYSMVTGYSMPHYCAWDWPKREQPYNNLVKGHQKAWDVIAGHTALPYIPVATLGWDPRPWQSPDTPDEAGQIYYPSRNPEGVETMVSNAVKWLEQHPEETTKTPILLLYAWNEYGEGGYLTPTDTDGEVYLEAVQRSLSHP